jgi:hypothetical protein
MNEDTRKELEKCSECGSLDRGTRYSISPPQIMATDPPEKFCKNAWHDVPPEVQRDETHEFTQLEFQFIFGVCWNLSIREIAEQCKVREDAVRGIVYQKICGKVGVSTRAELQLFVRDALNAELRRRLGTETTKCPRCGCGIRHDI